MEQSLQRLRSVVNPTRKGLADILVEEAARLTGSTMAYFAVTDEANEVLTMLAWSKTAMAICAVQEMPIVYPIEATGLWGDCIREGKPVITNDYPGSTRPTKKGCPKGHVPVLRHMNVAPVSGGRMRGILGVGNKAEPYTEADAALLQAFADAAWVLFEKASDHA